MKKMFTLTILLAAMGCATAPVAPPLDTTRVYNAPYEKVWASVVSEVSAEYPIKNIDKTSGLIASDPVSLSGARALTNAGYAPQVLLAIWGDSRARVTAFVSKLDDERTKVRLTLHLEGFEFNATKSWYVWQSNGTLENALLDRIQSNL
ncbi:MAG: hypothetical protein ACLPT4_12790 [Verrucomicrobiia bacterium]